ncbi:MAG: hypothetical protein IT179_14700 [Acidobacteria bacterium]|nr:hypothetical protein [Acidobacteriota bacterium]
MHMIRTTAVTAAVGGLLAAASPPAWAADHVSGTIRSTYVIVEDTELAGDVVCEVTGGPCFSFGAPDVELRLNGFSITGRADPVAACGGALTAGESGVSTGNRSGVTVRGPGLIQRFRLHGVAVLGSTGARVEGVTVATNCGDGIFIAPTSFDTLVQRNVVVRNGASQAGFSGGGI